MGLPFFMALLVILSLICAALLHMVNTFFAKKTLLPKQPTFNLRAYSINRKHTTAAVFCAALAVFAVMCALFFMGPAAQGPYVIALMLLCAFTLAAVFLFIKGFITAGISVYEQ